MDRTPRSDAGIMLLTLLLFISVISIISSRIIGTLFGNNVLIISALMVFFSVVYMGNEDSTIVGQVLVSILDRDASPGDLRFNTEASPMEERVIKAADESFPAGYFLVVSGSLIGLLLIDHQFGIPRQIYGLFTNATGGILLAIDRPHKLGTESINPETLTKQSLEGIWGASLLALGFLLQLTAVSL